MSKDKKEGKTCMVVMNSILLIVAIILLGGSIYIQKGNNIPPVLKELSEYVTIATILSVVLIVFAIIGYCASCGGCFLYIYTIFTTLLSVVCVVLTIIVAIIYGMVAAKKENSLIKAIDNITETMIENIENRVEWKNIQDTLECCGYNGIEKTGDACANEENVDCREGLMNVLVSYGLIALIVSIIISVVILILNCSSCKRMKNDCDC